MFDEAPLPLARRRSWPRILALMLVLVAVGSGATWLAWPKSVTATALFEVPRERITIFGNEKSGDSDAAFALLKNTQLALLKSNFLLTSALRNPRVGGSPVFAGVSDPEEWLQDHLNVEFPQDGELLSISLRGPAAQAEDIRVVVDAVAEAYKTEVLGNETAQRLNQRDRLERSL